MPAEITFQSVRITSGGRTQDARVRLDDKTETATLSVAQPIAAGPATIEAGVHRHSERQAARLLSKPRERTRVRRHAAGTHRWAPSEMGVTRVDGQPDVEGCFIGGSSSSGNASARVGGFQLRDGVLSSVRAA